MKRKFRLVKYIEIVLFLGMDILFCYLNLRIHEMNLNVHSNVAWEIGYYLLWAFAVLSLVVLLLDLQYIITTQKEKVELEYAAYYDLSTELPNRNSTTKLMDEYEASEDISKVCCVMFDLNNLKKVNDTLGHKSGDVLIRAFAKILKECSEPYGYISRHGGDEFLNIFDDCTEKKVAEYMDSVEKRVTLYNKEAVIKIDYAYGIALQSENHMNKISALIAVADYNMYQCKMKQKQQNPTQLKGGGEQ